MDKTLHQTEKPAVSRRAFFVSWRRGRRRPGTPRRRTHQQAPLLKGGRERRSGDCPAAKCRQKEAAAAAGQPLRCAAFFKRQPAVRQSLRHGTSFKRQLPQGNPSGLAALGHLPLTREAKPPQTLRPSANPTPARTPCRGAHCAPGEPCDAAYIPGGMNPAPTNRGKSHGRPQTTVAVRSAGGS